MEQIVLDRGLDLYREISCALGSEATAEHHLTSSLASGSTWTADMLAKAHGVLSKVPFRAEVLKECAFLHFGTTRQLITSGLELLQYDHQTVTPGTWLDVNNRERAKDLVHGGDSWVEGCLLAAPLNLAGQNVVVGVDVESPLDLPRGACLDVIAGHTPAGRPVWFVRCYHISDTFKDPLVRGGTFQGQPMAQWLMAVGVTPDDVWDASIEPAKRSLWDAKVFPAVDRATDYRDWLWMFDPIKASPDEKEAYLAIERFSVAEIALLADMKAFYSRRVRRGCD
jgi:hypothetical protein